MKIQKRLSSEEIIIDYVDNVKITVSVRQLNNKNKYIAIITSDFIFRYCINIINNLSQLYHYLQLTINNEKTSLHNIYTIQQNRLWLCLNHPQLSLLILDYEQIEVNHSEMEQNMFSHHDFNQQIQWRVNQLLENKLKQHRTAIIQLSENYQILKKENQYIRQALEISKRETKQYFDKLNNSQVVELQKKHQHFQMVVSNIKQFLEVQLNRIVANFTAISNNEEQNSSKLNEISLRLQELEKQFAENTSKNSHQATNIIDECKLAVDIKLREILLDSAKVRQMFKLCFLEEYSIHEMDHLMLKRHPKNIANSEHVFSFNSSNSLKNKSINYFFYNIRKRTSSPGHKATQPQKDKQYSQSMNFIDIVEEKTLSK